uniref:Uncharacterized protein n=2 Tax=Oryza sativa subsp. japonica TaxID=39947 RepID=A0A5S6RB41_ORYSJ|nr:Unknown protein [Oryza sativa]AAL73057.1 Unknown protein [Oryza sativa]AAP52055.1 hypothetical protein LOC_Os10g04910 [Oryza sativa Japonica Group]
MWANQSYHQVLDTDSHNEMEVVLMLARMIGPKEKKDSNIIPSHPRAIKSDNGEYNHVVIRLRVIGFIDDPNSILVRTELSVFMVDIESNGYQQLSWRINFATVYPYVSFYSTDMFGQKSAAKSLLEIRVVSDMDIFCNLGIKSTSTLIHLKASFWTCTGVKQISQASCFYINTFATYHASTRTSGTYTASAREISGFGFSHHRQDVIPMPGSYFTNDDSYHTAMIGSCNSPEHAGTDDCDCQSMKFHITIALTTYPTSVWMTAT